MRFKFSRSKQKSFLKPTIILKAAVEMTDIFRDKYMLF